MGWFSVLLSFTSGYFPWLGLFQAWLDSRASPAVTLETGPRSNFLRISQARHQHLLTFFPSSFPSPVNLHFFSALPSIAVQGPHSFFPHSFHRSIHCLDLHSLLFFVPLSTNLCALSLTQSAWQTPQLRKTVSSSHCRRQHGTHIKPNHVLDY